MTRIRAERPVAPEPYGYSTAPEGMLDWEQVSTALGTASIYWIATVRPDGSPHLHSIWGAFVESRLFVEGGETTRWARNLTADPRVSFGAQIANLHVSGRGRVVRGPAGPAFEAVRSGYGAKYGYQPETDDFWWIQPDSVIALDLSSLEEFARTPTKFVFEEAS